MATAHQTSAPAAESPPGNAERRPAIDRTATSDQAGSETNTELTAAQVAFLSALTTLGVRLFTAAPGGEEFTGRPAAWQQLDPAGNGDRVRARCDQLHTDAAAILSNGAA
jgi:hypothetical protein